MHLRTALFFWSALCFFCVEVGKPADTQQHQEQDGLVVIEAENNASPRGHQPKSESPYRLQPPPGRLAIVADGNSPDPDDIGATAVMFGLLKAANLGDRLVHLSHSCDLKPSKRISAKDEKRRQQKLHDLCNEGVARFGPFENVKQHFNCRQQRQAAIDDLRDAINDSNIRNPLWIIEAGEPDVIGFALEAASANKRKFVHVVSHHPANDNSGAFFKWQQILDFGVQEHQIGDQNVGLQSKIAAWDWAKEHTNDHIKWIWQQLSYAEKDGVVKFQSNKFDCSDAGMVYWWMTGANRGGCRNASPADIKEQLSQLGSTSQTKPNTNSRALKATSNSPQSSSQGTEPAADAKTNKNVLIVFVDDLRPELKCYGKDYIHSPNIDALAASGLIFDRAYCQQGICAPSRASMMAGQYPDSLGIYDLWSPVRKTIPDVMTMPKYFMQRGYETSSFGKVYHHHTDDKAFWNQLPDAPGEKYADAQTVKDIARRTKEARAKGLRGVELFNVARGPAVEFADVPDESYRDGAVAQQAIAALQNRNGKPFFMCVGFAKPHLPFAAPKRYWDLYQRDQFSAPKRELPADAPTLAFTKWGELRGYAGIPGEGPLTDEKTKELMHGYAASVSFADSQIGKVLAELDRLNLRKETIVVLWGDHGYKLGDYGLWCKHTNLELDTRVPLIVSAPGFKTNSRTQSLVEIVDLFPTLAKLTNGDVPPSCDGKSLEALLEDPDKPFREYAISQYPRGSTMGYSLRDQRWRYTEWINTKSKKIVARELYDHGTTDRPSENVASRPEHADLIESLSKKLNSRGRTDNARSNSKKTTKPKSKTKSKSKT